MLGKVVIFTMGTIIEGVIGVITTGLVVAAKLGDKQGQKVQEAKKETKYRCKINAIKECRDMCCYNWACEINPAKCSQLIQ